ncbi:MAG: ABC transporter permease, partial [Cytophagaceae bacterium]|nr:ABC transporter permease [Gemmatimonadaceae bacterium]
KVTRGLGTQLRATAAGGGGLGFGGVWTAVIVAQVAVTVVFPVIAFVTRRAADDTRAIDAGFDTQFVLSARLEMDRDGSSAAGALRDTTEAAFHARVAATHQELERRLLAEPTVAGVTVANWLPRLYPGDYFVAVDERGAVPSDPRWSGWYRLSGASVDPAFFSVLGVPILAGRAFHPGDLDSGGRATIVNESFVKKVLGDRNPIGRHIRYTRSVAWNDGLPTFDEPSPWYEIVGVAPDMGMAPVDALSSAGFFLPASPGQLNPRYLAIKVRGDPSTLIPRVRAIALDIDPALRLYDAMPIDRLDDEDLNTARFAYRGFVAVSVLALMLSLAGIYAVMAFTVARRSREIGIRVALGAGPRRVLVDLFRRPIIQVALGVGTGALVIVGFVVLGARDLPTPGQFAAVVGYSALMLAVCLLSCVVPTRRALAVQPTDVLKAE